MKNLPYMYKMSQSEFPASLTFLELEKIAQFLSNQVWWTVALNSLGGVNAK